MRKYTLVALIDFTDKYDETVKYKANENITVDEERALELLSSNTPVVRYVSREEDNSLKEIETLTEENTSLKTQVETLTEEIQKLTKKSTKKEIELTDK